LIGNDPVMSKLIYAFTTHTYKNRGIVGGQKGVEILTKMMGIDHSYLPAFLRYYDNDPNNLVGDWTSLAIRLEHWAGAVSKQHRDDVATAPC
jgi:hypothetical protein